MSVLSPTYAKFLWKRSWTDKRKRFIALPRRYPKIYSAAKALLVSVSPAIVALGKADFTGTPVLESAQKIAAHFSTGGWLFGILISPLALSFLLSFWEASSERAAAAQSIKDEFFAVLQAVDMCVALKTKRIDDLRRQLVTTKAKVTKSAALMRLCKPQDQINHLMQQFYVCIRELTRDKEVALHLVEIQESLPVRYRCIKPEGSEANRLFDSGQQQKTTFYFAVLEQRPLVIADIEKYLAKTPPAERKYCESSEGGDVGSIITIPIKLPDSNTFAFALSLYSTIPGVFNEDNLKKYTKMADYFTRRILMEYSLEIVLSHLAP